VKFIYKILSINLIKSFFARVKLLWDFVCKLDIEFLRKFYLFINFDENAP